MHFKIHKVDKFIFLDKINNMINKIGGVRENGEKLSDNIFPCQKRSNNDQSNQKSSFEVKIRLEYVRLLS